MMPAPLPDAPAANASRFGELERIRHNLVGLRMPRALEALDTVVQQLERGQIGAIEAIDTLLAEELTVREGRRIKAALQMARLATIKTISGFDFSFQMGWTAPTASMCQNAGCENRQKGSRPR